MPTLSALAMIYPSKTSLRPWTMYGTPSFDECANNGFLQAMRLMGIAVDPSDSDEAKEAGKKPNFSSDVLRIELSGPSRSHFSILDVPGVFQSRTKDVTAQEMAGVKNLVSAEMRRKQSIVV